MDMVILHVACLNNCLESGVDAVVPMHIKHQSKYANVGLINITNVKIDVVDNQFDYDSNFDTNNLPSPFNKPDIVVFHEVYRTPYLNIFKSLLSNNIPYVVIPHGELNRDAQKRKWLKKKIANLLVFRKFINNALAIQTLSEREKRNTGFRTQKVVATNGIVCPSNKKETFNKDKLIFSYIGRFNIYHKGIDLLIEAISINKKYFEDNKCEFHLYGPYSYSNTEDKMNKMLDKYNERNIVFVHDQIYGKEKEKTLLASDLFVQTSRFEGMPMGLLEALGYGIPCVVTEGTTLSQLIDDNNAGFAADNDPQSISDALVKAVENRNKLGVYSTNARELILRVFDWDKVAVDTINCYKALLKENNNA